MCNLALKIFLGLIILAHTGYSSGLNYSAKEIFPVHQDMAEACQFWIKIYAAYNTNQYVIHDSRKMDVIYEVVTWGELDERMLDDPYTKKQKTYFKTKTKYYRDILSSIAAVYPDTNKMNPDQRKVLRQLNGFESKNDFLEAMHRIRIQRGQKNKFKRGLEISGRYMAALNDIFKKYELPEELTVLPHVESSFNYEAYSSAGAAGIWQFTRGTGKQFLTISYEVDERLDPIVATEAAAKLLKQNYEELGSWPLAITAYNHGLHGMKRAVKKLNTKELNTIINEYRSRYFKFASRNFYCEFIAALHVVQNYETYFGSINFENPIAYKEFLLNRYIKYETLTEYLDIDNDLFRKYNPALRQSVYNNSKYIPKGYRIRVPSHLALDSVLENLPETDSYAYQKQNQYYRIRSGDTLNDIAKRFGTSVEMILVINNISNAHYIRQGMTIRIPEKTDLPWILAVQENNQNKTDRPTQSQSPVPAALSMPEEELTLSENDQILIDTPMMAQPADSAIFLSLWQPETPALDTTTKVSANIQTNGKSLTDLEIEFLQAQEYPLGYIRVEPEETLGHYSEWLNVKTQKIRDWNTLSLSSNIHLNQKIKLIFENVRPDEFNRLRLEFHRGLEDDFFSNYEITDTLTHRIKDGENLWYLCNYIYNLPLWLVVDFNKNVDLKKLKAGDQLTIPTVKSKR